MPYVREIFPNPRLIEETLRAPAMILRTSIDTSAVPASLSSMLGGPFAINAFRKSLRLSSSSSQRGFVVNFDHATVLSLNLWLFADSTRRLREKMALLRLQRFFRKLISKFAGPVDSQTPRIREELKGALELDRELNAASS